VKVIFRLSDCCETRGFSQVCGFGDFFGPKKKHLSLVWNASAVAHLCRFCSA